MNDLRTVSRQLPRSDNGAALAKAPPATFLRYDGAIRRRAMETVNISALLVDEDRTIALRAHIVKMSLERAEVVTLYPATGPKKIYLFDDLRRHVYDCKVREILNDRIDLDLVDILSADKRRMFYAVQDRVEKPKVWVRKPKAMNSGW